MPKKNPTDPTRAPRHESPPRAEPDPSKEKKREEPLPAPDARVPRPPITSEEAIDESGRESFPASDPPSFTPTKI